MTSTRTSPTGPVALIILDGFGDAPSGPQNAISVAKPLFLRDLGRTYPRGQLITSGECVGLPNGLMGNSEVGHMNLGAGRIVWQDITRIDRAIRDGSFRTNQALVRAAEHAVKGGGSLHLIGLLSDGGVHSSDVHLRALIDLCRDQGVPSGRLFIHALLDGRDTPPRSGDRYVKELEAYLETENYGQIATICGRYYAMDRDKRWDRVEQAYRCLVAGKGEVARSAGEAVRSAYARGEGDEFVLPTVVGSAKKGRIRDGDAVIFFNFRADRARELTLALMDPRFEEFAPADPRPALHYVSMTRYRADFPDLGVREAFGPQELNNVLADVVAGAGLNQLRIAETEKYAHVTYFFSGGAEEERKHEERILIPSPKVPTYDLKPEMSAIEVTDRLVKEIARKHHDFIVLNLANPDMVGHTGFLDAAVAAVTVVDRCLSRIIPALLGQGGMVLLTADHGNCEQMWDDANSCPHTAHTTNPVPMYLIGKRFIGARLREGGALADVSPTLLEIMGLEAPPEMTARSLL
ncbi:MAG: 2,3-bisphosphoglycerate-independent phosphoglycerate mutase [Planctomycetota bacterium]